MRLIAFYLPQFYENDVNNKNWGKGFTEWTNVINSYINNKNYKTMLPTELGYYDLRDDNVRYAQAELATQYGIDGWCYYYYRFNNKRVLDIPLKRHFNDKKLDMPFLICWANENWTRSWDGLNEDILIKQEHNLDDDLNFIEEISTMLVDDRYFKIDGKPVILIYRTDLWQDIKKTTSIWRSYMHKRFNKEIYLIKCHTWLSYQNPYDLGFDAAYQFPPHLMDIYLANYLQWEDFVKMPAHFKLFRGVMTGFDNRVRKKENGYVFLGASPNSYGDWLSEAISYTKKYFKKEEQLIFINAWNEWGESAVLEPSNHWGRLYLETTFNSKYNIKLN